MLQDFVATHHDEIVLRCRAKGFARSLPATPYTETEHGVPLFLEQLVVALSERQSESQAINGSAVLHGNDLFAQGASISQVVHGYGDVCQSITELASETATNISSDDFRILNGCLDGAIAGAVTQFDCGRGAASAGLAAATENENERRGFLAHELRDLIHTATIAFAVVKSGTVGYSGSTGQIIDRALLRAGDLISRSLAEVRLSEAQKHLENVPVAELVAELAATGELEANVRGIRLTTVGGGEGAWVKADRAALATALMNLLQNALKFTRQGTTVTLRVRATDDRVLIEVQDECGGLPSEDIELLFHSFQQRHDNRTGLGLGLVFTRQAVEAIGGVVSARNVPHSGCVFSVDLPRLSMPANNSR